MSDLTYLQLRTEIAARLNRDDLDASATAPLQRAVHDRILHYGTEFFYATDVLDTTVSTATGIAWVDLPDRWQNVSVVRVNIGGVWHALTRVRYEYLAANDALVAGSRGVPSEFALRINPLSATQKMGMRMFPVPGSIYNIEFQMDVTPAAPVNDADVNFWTTQGQLLLINSVCENLSKLTIGDETMAAAYKDERVVQELAIGSKTVRMRGGIRVKPSW